MFYVACLSAAHQPEHHANGHAHLAFSMPLISLEGSQIHKYNLKMSRVKNGKGGKGRRRALDVSAVPEQPLILKHQLESFYRDNTRTKRRRPSSSRGGDGDGGDGGASSQYVGLYRELGMWHAQIMVRGRVHNLGVLRRRRGGGAGVRQGRLKIQGTLRLRPAYFLGTESTFAGIPEQPLRTRLDRKSGGGGNDDDDAAVAAAAYVGVKRCRDRWQPRLKIGKRMRYLGTYDTPEEAAQVYAKAELFLRQKKKEENIAKKKEKRSDGDEPQESQQQPRQNAAATTATEQEDDATTAAAAAPVETIYEV